MNEHAFPSQLRVLVVDDCQDTTATLSTLLRIWGYDVRAAHDGPTALHTARAFRPHVVLLDVALWSKADGLDVARQLRTEPRLTSLVVICLSGYATDVDRRRSLDAGADHHFAKPVDPDELHRLLAAVKDILPDGEPAGREGSRSASQQSNSGPAVETGEPCTARA